MITATMGKPGEGGTYPGTPGTVRYALAQEARMSDNARRVVVLRHWVEALEAEPRNSAWYEQQLMQSQARLVHEAAHIIGQGC